MDAVKSWAKAHKLPDYPLEKWNQGWQQALSTPLHAVACTPRYGAIPCMSPAPPVPAFQGPHSTVLYSPTHPEMTPTSVTTSSKAASVWDVVECTAGGKVKLLKNKSTAYEIWLNSSIQPHELSRFKPHTNISPDVTIRGKTQTVRGADFIDIVEEIAETFSISELFIDHVFEFEESAVMPSTQESNLASRAKALLERGAMPLLPQHRDRGAS